MQLIKTVAKDSLLVSIILGIYHPFHLEGDEKSKIWAFFGMLIINFIVSLLTAFFVNRWFPSTENGETMTAKSEIKKLTWQYLINIPLLAVVIGFYLGWQMRGDIMGIWNFGEYYSLWPLATLIPGVAFVYIPLYFWNRNQLKKRFLKIEVEELQSLNTLLECEQKELRSRLNKENLSDKIIINGDSRESLIVNPLDILFIESVGNYLSIAYFDNADLCQKRLRSSLKEVEEILEVYPFIVHIHRAFLVNINYITQVSGNSAGYKISMFSTDRVLPVSKANVNLFREKISNLGNFERRELG